MPTDPGATALYVHEATHAVMAKLCAFPVRSVAVGPARRGSDVGMLSTLRMVTGDTVGSYYYELLEGVSGGAGEAVFRCAPDPAQMPLYTRDLVEATVLLRNVGQSTDGGNHPQLAAELFEHIRALWDEASHHLRQPGAMRAVGEIVDILERGDAASGHELEQAVQRHLPMSAGVREPTSAFPQWYLRLTGKPQDELVCLRRADYAAIWDYYTRNP